MDFAPLRTERLTLRPPREDDAEALHRLVNDWAVVRMLTKLPFPYPREMMDRWIAAAERDLEAGTAVHVLITGEEGGRELLLGVVGLRRSGKAGSGGKNGATLGYWVTPRFWGHGVATEAASRLARWAMANLPIEKLTASVAVDNPASAAVLRRIGFREAGNGTQEFVARGGKHPITRFVATRADFFPATVPAAVPAAASEERPLMLVAACALVDADGRVLVARRPEGKPMAGLWEFPGGKLAPGETPEAALVRELKEELGIDTRTACLAPFAFASHPYERFHLLMPLYLCRRWTGRPKGREGQELAWVWPAKLVDYPMPEADKPLIPLLREFL